MTVAAEASRLKAEARREFEARFSEVPPAGPSVWGRAAERLRRLDAYRRASCIMASLDHALSQVRLNALTDRKALLLPSPGLHKGFFLLRANEIPPAKRRLAVRPHEANPFGRRVPYDERLDPPVGLLLTGAVAVGRDGSVLGDGAGFTDLQAAILAALGWLAPEAALAVLVEEHRIVPTVPTEPTDIRASFIVTPESVMPTSFCGGIGDGRILWEKLQKKDIRRNDVLFHLYKAMQFETE